MRPESSACRGLIVSICRVGKTATSPERILERAIVVLQESGEAGIRTHQIAEDCGVTAPILYRAFGDREGLIVAAQAARYERSMLFGLHDFAPAVAGCTNGDEFRQLMVSLSDSRNSLGRHDDRRIRVEVLGAASTRPRLREKVNEANKRAADSVEPLFRMAADKGWMRSDFDIRAAIMWWIGMMTGRVMIEMADGEFDQDAWSDIARRTMLHLLFGDR